MHPRWLSFTAGELVVIFSPSFTRTWQPGTRRPGASLVSTRHMRHWPAMERRGW